MKKINLIYISFLSLQFLTILFLQNFTLQDLPDHIARASILKGIIFSNEFISNNFKLDLFFAPYLIPDILNCFLLTTFDFKMVSKLYVIFSILIYFYGTFKYINNKYLSIIPLVLMFNLILFKGNITFIFGMGILFWCLSNYKKDTSFWKTSAFSIIIYSSHLLCLFVWMFIIGIESFKNKQFKNLIVPVILCLMYFLHNSVGIESEKYEFGNLIDNAKNKFFEIKTLFSTLDSWWFLPLLILPLYFYSKKNIFIPLSLIILALFLPNNVGSLVRPFERLFIISLILAIPYIKFNEKILKYSFWILLIICYSEFSIFYNNLYKSTKILEVNTTIHKLIKPNSKVSVIKNNFYYSLMMHYDKYLICEKNCVVNDLFELKHTLIRYKNKNYFPDYIITYGNIRIDNPMFKNICNKDFVKLYERIK